jgi:hypothetical protein
MGACTRPVKDQKEPPEEPRGRYKLADGEYDRMAAAIAGIAPPLFLFSKTRKFRIDGMLGVENRIRDALWPHAETIPSHEPDPHARPSLE